MLMVGLQIGETGAALDLMTRSLSLTDGQQAAIVSLRAFGGVVSGLVIWLAAMRLRIGLILGMVHVSILASALLLPSGTYASALLISAIRGIAAGAVVPLSGIFASRQQDRPSGEVAATVNAAVSAGLFAVSGFAAILAATNEPDWRLYWIPSVAVSTLLLLMLPRSGFTGRAAQSRNPETAARLPLATRLRNQVSGTAWVFAIAVFFLVGAEIMIFGLVPARSVARGPIQLSGEFYALAVMGGVLVGRIMASGLLNRFLPGSVAASAGTGVIASAALWTLIPRLTLLWVLCMGLATASFFPAMVGLVSRAVPSRAARTIGAAGWTGGLGGVVVPAIVGVALERGSGPGTPGLVIALSASAAVLLFHIGRHRYSESEDPASAPL